MPAPCLLKTQPATPLRVPAKVVEALFPPALREPLPRETLAPLGPASEPMISLWPFTSNIPELASVTAAPSAIWSKASERTVPEMSSAPGTAFRLGNLFSNNVPALTVVTPEKVLVALPESSSTPGLSLNNPPLPTNGPLRVNWLLVLTTMEELLEPSVTVPVSPLVPEKFRSVPNKVNDNSSLVTLPLTWRVAPLETTVPPT